MMKDARILTLLLSTFMLAGCSQGLSLKERVGDEGTIEKVSISASSSVNLTESSSLILAIVFSGPVPEDATLSWDIPSGGSDFASASGTISITKGDETANLNIALIDDVIYEADKNFVLNLSGTSTYFSNSLTVNITLTDNDTPVTDPTLAIQDGTTSSTTYARQQAVDISLTNDGTAVKWCLSETQSTRPTVSDTCIGGQGASDGWSLTRPTSFNLSSTDSLKTVYVWIADSSNNINAGPTTAAITLDETLPGTPTVSLSDTDTSSTTATDAATVDLSITSDTDGVAWCVIEQDESTADISTPPVYNDGCWVGTRPTTLTLGAEGLREAFVFTKDVAGNVSATFGKATITYTIPIVKVTLSTSSSTMTLTEGGSLALTINFSGPAHDDTSITWSIASGSADFSTTSGTLNVLKDDTSANLNVGIIDDGVYEATENYTLSINGDSTYFNNNLSIALTLNDDDTALGDPTLALQDGTTLSTSYARQQAVSVSIGSDATATKWCLSETQSTAPSSSGTCNGGQGASSGWHLSRPTSYNLSTSDGLKTVYLWIVDGSGNINAGPVSDTITLDETLPGTPTITLSDVINASTTLSYSPTVNMPVTNDTDAVAWCVLEQAETTADVSAPAYNNGCWAGVEPTTAAMGASGLREVFVFTKDVAGNVSATFGKATITYTPNQAPTAVDDGPLLVSQNSSATAIDVLAYGTDDSDPESETLTITAVTSGSNGASVVITGGGTGLTYQPATNFGGIDTFTYTISDPRGATDTATVTVNTISPYTWTGAAADSNWFTSANWCGSIASNACQGDLGPPGSSDVAVFNDYCGSNCNANINASITIGGFSASSAYTGTITQVTGGSQSETITVSSGGSGWVQAGGTFVGGDADIEIWEIFNISGSATYTSTSANLTIKDNQNSTTTYDFFKLEGSSTFNHNNGKVVLGGTDGWGGGTPIFVLDVVGTQDFYNLELNGGTSYRANFTVGTGDVITVLNDLELTAGAFAGPDPGEVILKGNLYFGGYEDTGRNYIDAVKITMNSAGTQTYTSAGGKNAVMLEIDKASGDVSPAVGTTNIGLAALNVKNGTFNAPATGEVSLSCKHNATEELKLLNVEATATFNPYNSKFVLAARDDFAGGVPTFVIDVPTSMTFYEVELDTRLGTSYSSFFKIGAGDVITVTNALTITAGTFESGGSIELTGDLNIGSIQLFSGEVVNTLDVTMNGTGAQTYSSAGGAAGISLIIDKASGTVAPAGSISHMGISTFYLKTGSFTAPDGEFAVAARDNVSTDYTTFQVDSGTTFDPNGGTLIFAGTDNFGGGTPTFVMDVPTTLTLNNLTLYGGYNQLNYPAYLKVATGDTINVAGELVFANGYFASGGGTLQAQGNVSISDIFDGGSGGFILNGSSSQSMTSAGGILPSGTISINNTSGVTVASDIVFNGNIQLVDGVVDAGGYSLTGILDLDMGVSTGNIINFGTLTYSTCTNGPCP